MVRREDEVVAEEIRNELAGLPEKEAFDRAHAALEEKVRVWEKLPFEIEAY